MRKLGALGVHDGSSYYKQIFASPATAGSAARGRSDWLDEAAPFIPSTPSTLTRKLQQAVYTPAKTHPAVNEATKQTGVQMHFILPAGVNTDFEFI